MTTIIIIIIGVSAIVATACIAAHITTLKCNSEFESEWQIIEYTGSSVEPKNIYICKSCNNKSDINFHYCDNCGAYMRNGIERINYTGKISLSDELSE